MIEVDCISVMFSLFVSYNKGENHEVKIYRY